MCHCVTVILMQCQWLRFWKPSICLSCFKCFWSFIAKLSPANLISAFIAIGQTCKEIGTFFSSVPRPLLGPFLGIQGLSLGLPLLDFVFVSSFLLTKYVKLGLTLNSVPSRKIKKPMLNWFL
jgi:hypothetical protein